MPDASKRLTVCYRGRADRSPAVWSSVLNGERPGELRKIFEKERQRKGCCLPAQAAEKCQFSGSMKLTPLKCPNSIFVSVRETSILRASLRSWPSQIVRPSNFSVPDV